MDEHEVWNWCVYCQRHEYQASAALLAILKQLRGLSAD